MTRYEYQVLTPPAKGVKAPGRKTPEARHANAVEVFLNAQAAEGWEYLRSDILPGTERQGLTSSQTVYRTVMVFRRPLGEPAETVIAEAQAVAEAEAPAEPEPAARTDTDTDSDDTQGAPEPPKTDPKTDPAPGDTPAPDEDEPRKPE